MLIIISKSMINTLIGISYILVACINANSIPLGSLCDLQTGTCAG